VTFADWITSDSWMDYRQQQALRDLDDEVASLSSTLSRQYQESSRLRSELGSLRGSVEERLTRLTRSFDAFVELSDLRMVLALFDPPALVRHRARTVIAASSEGAEAGAAAFDDVPGYWLAPATKALVALLRGESAGEHLALAEGRDAGRTALLLAVATAVAGRTDLSAEWLPRALGPLPAGAPVSRAQRTLWTEAAAGTFGSAGRDALAKRLAELVDGLPPERSHLVAEAWWRRVEGIQAFAPKLPSTLERVPDAAGALAAGVRLERLRELCETGASPGESSQGLAGVLRAIVDEGSVEEVPLLRRAAELRAVIEDRPVPEAWDAPGASPLELLEEDAFRADGSPLARLARTAGARWLQSAGERLAEAAAVDPPAQATASIERVSVRVAVDGVDEADLAGALRTVETRYPDERVPTAATIATLVAGGLLCLAVIGWPNPLAVLSVLIGLVVLAVGGRRWWREAQNRAHRRGTRTAALEAVRRRAGEAVADLATLRGSVTAAGERATADLTALRSALSRTTSS
jgi:membrane protein implicated in regulation of membrane protease activity